MTRLSGMLGEGASESYEFKRNFSIGDKHADILHNFGTLWINPKIADLAYYFPDLPICSVV